MPRWLQAKHVLCIVNVSIDRGGMGSWRKAVEVVATCSRLLRPERRDAANGHERRHGLITYHTAFIIFPCAYAFKYHVEMIV